jgi:hypothetical protein
MKRNTSRKPGRCPGVRRLHVEAELVGAELSGAGDDLGDERAPDSATPCCRPHVHVREVRPALVGLRRERVADRLATVLGQEGGALLRVPGEIGPRLVPALLEARRRRHLGLELLPQGADDLGVVPGDGTDVHARSLSKPARR